MLTSISFLATRETLPSPSPSQRILPSSSSSSPSSGSQTTSGLPRLYRDLLWQGKFPWKEGREEEEGQNLPKQRKEEGKSAAALGRERERGKWVGEKRANEERRKKRARLKCLIFLLFLVPISPALAAAAAEDPSGRSNYLSFQSRREDPRLFPPPWAPPFLRYFTASADSTFPLPHFFFSWGVSSLFPATHFRPFALL